MPIYEYQCDYCNKKFEYLVFRDLEPQQCQYCDKEEIRRVMSTCSFFNNTKHGGNVGDYDGVGSSSSCGSCTSSDCSGCK